MSWPNAISLIVVEGTVGRAMLHKFVAAPDASFAVHVLVPSNVSVVTAVAESGTVTS
jgi:hypothetical protein